MDELRNGYKWIPKENRKKILLVCDDIRMNSGVATMGREIVLNTCHYFNWVVIGGAIRHPDKGKIFDMAQTTEQETGVKDVYVKLYPVDDYGNQQIIRELINLEKPNAIVAYTDPRFFLWLFHMENEIRQKIPMFYYSIWGDVPYPYWNKSYYESCDLHMCISKQTKNIVRNVLGEENVMDLDAILKREK